jgi:uncharacterized protein YhhL (DUF1145 family)
MATRAVRELVSGFRQEARQFDFLTRHFFHRLFRNEIVDFEDQMKERLIAVLSILAIIIFWGSETLLFKYNFVADAGSSWQEKSYIFTLVMIIFGIVTLLEWDALFPDRQDFLNLTPLPVRLRTLFFAKLASSVLFIGLFSVAMNCGAAVLFSLYLARWRVDKDLLFACRYAASHLLSAFAACFFVFFACVFLQFLLMAVLPFGLYRRLSLYVRAALIALFIFLLLAFLVEPGILDGSFRSMASLKDAGEPFFYRFPPFWFVGLYEKLLGTGDPAFEALARTALLAMVVFLAGFAAASGLSYHRHVRRTLESGKTRLALTGVGRGWRRWLGKTVLRTPEERAVYGFFAKTIHSSPKQRVTMAYYLAIAAGVVTLYIVANREGFRVLAPSNRALLVPPVFLAFSILAGIRALVNVPASPAANWIFQVTDTGRPMRYVAGLKKAIFLRWLVPLFCLVFAFHLIIWDFGPALEHALFGLTVSGLGLAAFFFRFRKIPFACTYVPGRTRIQSRLIPYVLFVLVFFSITSAIEKELLRVPWEFVYFFAISAGLWLAFRVDGRHFYRGASLLYEEEPDPAMVTFPENP